MMNRYIIAYLGWLLGTLGMAVAALLWYRHVEQIGVEELASRMMPKPATDATEATHVESAEDPAA